ncbi:DUF6093 family protein [Streptomyces sp. t39]|uniref:DUF6093 family protein n=1 Tax=Streptomyces sp. t39 TaxID=1828156 RepID=UPI0011CE9743|nr:DUF6093 family protein [Streptomyces sp. t39]TXS35359.1 hypothetical protein EAO77_36910 [Streptomyces sp. t39]
MRGLEQLLARGRAAARELQRERIRLYRPGAGGIDWETGEEAPADGATLFEGMARVKAAAHQGEEVDAGEENVTLRDYVVSLDWDTPALAQRPQVGDRIEVLASPEARMVGLTLWVTGVGYGSTATAWRIGAEDRQ